MLSGVDTRSSPLCRESLRAARAALVGLRLAVLRGRRGDQLAQQPRRNLRDILHRAFERRCVRLRRLGETADLAHVLQSRRAYLVLGRGGLEVVESPDIATHTERVAGLATACSLGSPRAQKTSERLGQCAGRQHKAKRSPRLRSVAIIHTRAVQAMPRRAIDDCLRDPRVGRDPGDHRRRVGALREDRRTLNHPAARAIRTRQADHKSADRIVVQNGSGYENSVTEYTGPPTRTAPSAPAASVCTTNASSRPWSRIAATTSPPGGSGLPTSISRSRPSNRQLSLKMRRERAGEPTTLCECSRNSR